MRMNQQESSQPAPRVTHIAGAFGDLEHAVSELDEAISALLVRVQPVCSPGEDAPPNAAQGPVAVEKPRAQLAVDLRVVTSKLRRILGDARDTLERLEL